MSDWQFAHAEAHEKFALVQYFSLTKVQDGREIEFTIAVKEYVHPPEPAMKFFASADKQTNQKTMPYTPNGWGSTMLRAVSECMQAIRRFPYEGQ